MPRGDSKIVEEAKRRYKRCQDWEYQARQNFKDDMRFAEGDDINMYQWETSAIEMRDGGPCLTVNRLREHNLQIVNDARQNKPQVRVQPVGDGASKEAAEIFEGIVRHIEYISDAQTAYDTATYFQVYGGIGYFRVKTDYLPGSFDQELQVHRISDPLTVHLDPDITRYDGSDAKFGFIDLVKSRDRWKEQYPKYADYFGRTAFDGAGDDWSNKDDVRVAEYYRVIEIDDVMFMVPPGMLPDKHSSGGPLLASDLDPMMVPLLEVSDAIPKRAVKNRKVEWYKIAGDKIIDRGMWVGSTVPIVRVVGEETVVDGKLDRKGHTRSMRDPQRIMNYSWSGYVEHTALYSKTPWQGPVETIEEFEAYYRTANRQRHAYLPYKAYNDANQPLPAPHRVDPPATPTAYVQGLQMAVQNMMMASGQYQAEFGAPGNEKSGVAINARQRQADNATYQYPDHLAQAIRYLGRILIEAIPKVYDTERVLRIMAEDGTEDYVGVAPNAPQAHVDMSQQPGQPMQQAPQFNGTNGAPYVPPQDINIIFNPNVGRYDVVADVGPAFATRRQEFFSAMLQIMQHNPDFAMKFGDIIWKTSDAPYSDELSERFKKMLPPGLTDDGPNPEVQALKQQTMQMMQGAMQQHQALQQQMQQTAQENQELKLRLADKSASAQVDAFQAKTSATDDYMDHQIELKRLELQQYQAETQRIAALGGIDPESMKLVARGEVSALIGAPALPIMAEHAKAEQAMAPPEPAAGSEGGE